jgi:hypothetical protein
METKDETMMSIRVSEWLQEEADRKRFRKALALIASVDVENTPRAAEAMKNAALEALA